MHLQYEERNKINEDDGLFTKLQVFKDYSSTHWMTQWGPKWARIYVDRSYQLDERSNFLDHKKAILLTGDG